MGFLAAFSNSDWLVGLHESMWHEFKIKSGHTLTIYAFIKIDKNIK